MVSFVSVTQANISRAIVLLVSLFFNLPSFFSQHQFDSLKNIWNNKTQIDTIRLNALYFVIEKFIESNPDSTIFYSDLLITTAKSKSLKKYEAFGLLSKGRGFLRKGETQKAYQTVNSSIPIFESIRNELGLANSYNTLGAIFTLQNDTSKIFEYYDKAMILYRKLNYKKGIAIVLSNKAAIRTGDRNCIKDLLESLKLFREIGDKMGIAQTLFKLAEEKQLSKMNKGIPDEFFQSLKTFEELNNQVWVSYIYSAIGRIYEKREDFQNAIIYAKKGYDIAVKYDLSKEKLDNLDVLILAYTKVSNYKDAFQLYKIYISERDSVNNIEQNNTIHEQELAHRLEKQKELDKKEQEKIQAIAIEQDKKQKLLLWSISIGLVLVLAFTFIILSKLRITRKQKRIIDNQSKRTEVQKKVIEEKQKEIIDSITYAKRLQQAIFPKPEFIKNIFTESFVLYKPKDIVAGDFYWMEVKGEKVLIAAADCTGHGVPGSIVSIVCSNALNRSLHEFGITNSGKMLDKTRELVVEAFSKSDVNVRDGMDISLCVFDLKRNLMEWSGANNPLWYITNNDLKEIKAHKQAIGYTDNPTNFPTHQINIQKGDTFYLITDGFSDQFGGEKGKKFKPSNIKKVLFENKHKSLEEQKEVLNFTFEDWKMEIEQVDDVTMIGIRV